MKPFGQWLNEQGNSDEIEVSQEFLEEFGDATGEQYYPCIVCDEDFLIEEPSRFDPDNHYCGCGGSCVPY